MEKAAIGLLRWGVILGLLVALPAFALRGKWGEIAALVLDDDVLQTAPTGRAGDLNFADSSQFAAEPSQTLKPLSPDDSQREISTSDNLPDHNATTSPDAAGSPDAPRARNLRVSVYRPLGDAQEQTIRRIPSFRVSIGQAGAADDARLAAMEQQLREVGAESCRWQYDAQSAEYHLVCEFPQRDARGQPSKLEARAADPASAMRQILADATARREALRR